MKIKVPNLFILIGLFISVFISIQITLNFDKNYVRANGVVEHNIIQSGIKEYWLSADKFKKDLDKDKNFFESGGELSMDYLYPKLIGLYYKILDQDITGENNKFLSNNYKFGIPIIQSIIYFLCLFFFYKKIKYRFNEPVVYTTIFFLALEPTLISYHSFYSTESLYLSILLVLFIFFIDEPKEYYKYFLVGLILGISYMQRNVSILLFLPIILYLFIFNKYKAIFQSILVLTGYSLILLFIGFNEYKKTNLFYFTPPTQGDAHWHYVAHKLGVKKNNLSIEESLNKKNDDLKLWIENNNIDLDNLKDQRRVINYKKKYFLKIFIENKFEYFKLHLYKSFQYLIINFSYSYNHVNLDKSVDRWWETDQYKKFFKIQIFYSIVLYLISFIGLIDMFKSSKENRRLSVFIIFIPLYFIIILGWTGISRYNVPNLIFLSVYFGFGINYLINKIRVFN